MSEDTLEISLDEKLDLYADTKLRFIELQNKFNKETADLQDALKSLESEIKNDVLKVGSTVKTDLVTATYKKGKETWDGKLLMGYAVAHPEILQAKKIGEPTVSLQIKRGV